MVIKSTGSKTSEQSRLAAAREKRASRKARSASTSTVLQVFYLWSLLSCPDRLGQSPPDTPKSVNDEEGSHGPHRATMGEHQVNW